MNLVKEAAYLYIHSKELIELNKKLKKLSKKAEKHISKHQKADDEAKREKHQTKHKNTTEEIKQLMKKHNKLLERIKHHHLTYTHALRKEYKV